MTEQPDSPPDPDLVADRTADSARRRVVVVFGGASSEHGVSCLTAASVLKAIDRQRYDVECIGITQTGRWTRLDPEWVAALVTTQGRLPSVPLDGVGAVLTQTDRGTDLCSVGGDGTFRDVVAVDVAFALLHGPFGEDGTIQGLFEMVGLRYVGSGVAASAIGMDKHLMKVVLGAAGLPQGQYRVIEPAQWLRDQAGSLASLDELGYPMFVKPARAGSSIGISKVDSSQELVAAIEGARKHDPKVVVEAALDGREIECAVLAGRGFAAPRTSLVGEIRMLTDDAFYDFDAKYLPEEQVALDIPATIDEPLQQAVQDLAVRTFEALGGEGLARVDTFVLRDGRVLVNEINTMPGFTELSMFPALWNASGMSYADLIDELITLAMERPLGLR